MDNEKKTGKAAHILSVRLSESAPRSSTRSQLSSSIRGREDGGEEEKKKHPSSSDPRNEKKGRTEKRASERKTKDRGKKRKKRRSPRSCDICLVHPSERSKHGFFFRKLYNVLSFVLFISHSS